MAFKKNTFPLLEISMEKIGIFSFFAGAGFLDLGFEKAGGFETLFVNEFHGEFLKIYRSTRHDLGIPEPEFGFQCADIQENLSNLNSLWLLDSLQQARKSHKIIGFIGGPPCPDFSVGGKNRGKDGENGQLSGTYAELICRAKPDFFLFENVKGLYRTKKHRAFFNSLKRKFKSNGYILTEKLINAIEYGAPQDRERIILIGFHQDFLDENGYNSRNNLKEFDWKKHTFYDADSLLRKDWPTQEKFIENSIKPTPKNVPIELTVDYWFHKNEVFRHPNANHHFQPRAGLAKFKVIDEGDDLKKSYKRLHRWRYSPTAAYGNNEVHLHPYKARRISAAEALAIQSLPKDFVIPGEISLSNMFKSIGNGVPFLAAKGLAKTICDFINENVLKINTENEEAYSKQLG